MEKLFTELSIMERKHMAIMAGIVKGSTRVARAAVIFASVLLSLAAFDATAVAEELFFRLKRENLVCVRDNLERYLQLPGDELLISVASCPDIPDNPLLDAAVNEGPDIEFADDAAPDTLIVVTREQLECLMGKAIGGNRPIYRFYPRECRLEPEE